MSSSQQQQQQQHTTSSSSFKSTTVSINSESNVTLFPVDNLTSNDLLTSSSGTAPLPPPIPHDHHQFTHLIQTEKCLLQQNSSEREPVHLLTSNNELISSARSVVMVTNNCSSVVDSSRDSMLMGFGDRDSNPISQFEDEEEQQCDNEVGRITTVVDNGGGGGASSRVVIGGKRPQGRGSNVVMMIGGSGPGGGLLSSSSYDDDEMMSLSPEPSGNHELMIMREQEIGADERGSSDAPTANTTRIRIGGGGAEHTHQQQEQGSEEVFGGGVRRTNPQVVEFQEFEFDTANVSSVSKTVKCSSKSVQQQQQSSYVSSNGKSSSAVQNQVVLNEKGVSQQHTESSSCSVESSCSKKVQNSVCGDQQGGVTTSSVVTMNESSSVVQQENGTAPPAAAAKKTKVERKSSKAGAGKKNKSNAEISKENISVACERDQRIMSGSTPPPPPPPVVSKDPVTKTSSCSTTSMVFSALGGPAPAPPLPEDLAKKLGPGESRVFAKVCVANLRRSFGDLTAIGTGCEPAGLSTKQLFAPPTKYLGGSSSGSNSLDYSTHNNAPAPAPPCCMRLARRSSGGPVPAFQVPSSSRDPVPGGPASLPTYCSIVPATAGTLSSSSSSVASKLALFQPAYWEGLFKRSGRSRQAIFNSPQQQKSSFSKFDSLVKSKSQQHTQGLENKDCNGATSEQQQEGGKPAEAKKLYCASCEKQVFQMELVRAEKKDWHKNCFRCGTCRKVLGVDTYQSHEQRLYCKPHFKELFQPKAVLDDDESGTVVADERNDGDSQQQQQQHGPTGKSVLSSTTQHNRSKLQLIICESQPKELPPDVVRASDAPTTGLEDIQIDVRSKFEMFENFKDSADNKAAPAELPVKRSASVLAKLKKYENSLGNGGSEMNGVSDDDLHGGVDGIELQSDNSDNGDDAEPNAVIKEEIKRKLKNPLQALNEIAHFKQMDQVRSKWEEGTFTRDQVSAEQRKEELQKFRSRLCQGKSGQLKELYEKGVESGNENSEASARIAEMEELKSERARVYREMFERGEVVKRSDGADEEGEEGAGEDGPVSGRSANGVDLDVFEAGVAKQSKRLFEEMDKKIISEQQQQQQQQQSQQHVTRNRSAGVFTKTVKLSCEGGCELSGSPPAEIVRSSDKAGEPVQVNTAELSNKFKFFETYENELAKKAKESRRDTLKRITPPREDGVVKTDKDYEQDDDHEHQAYRDPTIVRSGDQPQEDDTLQKSKTTSKMLSVFRQMEENLSRGDAKDPIIRPLKQFTPPRDTVGSGTGRGVNNESEEDDEEEEYDEDDVVDGEEDEEDEGGQETESRQTEDEFLKEVGSLARARSLRAKFERWEQQENERNKEQSGGGVGVVGPDELADSIESAKNLKAKFEAMRFMADPDNKENGGAGGGALSKGRSPVPIRVNRFVLSSQHGASSSRSSSSPEQRILISSSSSGASSSSTSPQLITGVVHHHQYNSNNLQHRVVGGSSNKHGFSSLPVEVVSSSNGGGVSSNLIMSGAATDPCAMCEKRVYVMEKIEAGGKMYHKNCFRCSHCKCLLRMDTFTSNKGTLFCTTHFKQLFKIKGNYDEGFGHETQYQVWAKKQAAAQPN